MDTSEIFRTLLDSINRVEEKNDKAFSELQTGLGHITGELGALSSAHKTHCQEDKERFDKLEKTTAESTQQRRADDAVKAAQALVVSESKAAALVKDSQRANFKTGVWVAACTTVLSIIGTLLVTHVAWR